MFNSGNSEIFLQTSASTTTGLHCVRTQITSFSIRTAVQINIFHFALSPLSVTNVKTEMKEAPSSQKQITKFWPNCLLGGNSLVNLGTHNHIILQLVLEKQGAKIWSELNWLTTGSN
jgi:hypothetical protein